jgi:hypothetical protein
LFYIFPLTKKYVKESSGIIWQHSGLMKQGKAKTTNKNKKQQGTHDVEIKILKNRNGRTGITNYNQ